MDIIELKQPTSWWGKMGYWLRKEWPQVLHNPIIQRECIQLLRKKRAYFCLAVILIVSTFAIVSLWNTLTYSHSHYNYDSLLISSRVYQTINMYIGITLLSITPIFSATCINTEREQDTWDLLLTTSMNPLSILWAKFFTQMFFAWILLVSLTPIYAICFIIGGFSPTDLIFTFLIYTEIIPLTVLIGMICSLYFHKVIYSTVITFVLLVIVFLVIPYSCLQLAMYVKYVQWPNWMSYLVWQSPILVSAYFFDSAPSLLTKIPTFGINVYLIHFICNVGLIIGLAALTIRQLYTTRNKIEEDIRIDEKESVPIFTSEPEDNNDGISHENLISDRQNPLVVKEWKELYHSNPNRILREIVFGIAGCIFLILCFILASPSNAQRLSFMFQHLPILITLFIPFLVIYNLSHGFSSERYKNTWDMILTTNLTPQNIVSGRLRAAFQVFQMHFWSFAAVYYCLFFDALFHHPDYLGKTSEDYVLSIGRSVFLIPLSYCSFWLLTSFSLLIAIRFKKTIVTIAMTLIFAIILFLLIPTMTETIVRPYILKNFTNSYAYLAFTYILSIPSSPFVLLLFGLDITNPHVGAVGTLSYMEMINHPFYTKPFSFYFWLPVFIVHIGVYTVGAYWLNQLTVKCIMKKGHSNECP
jgi:ABC-type transport system involved in multi-copper enzyme maturation permease subunit